jgi:hypothetical protein
LLNIEHIAPCHPLAAQKFGIGIAVEFEHVTAHITRVALKKVFKIVPIDG